MRSKFFLVLLTTLALIQLSGTGLAKLETIQVGNHTVSMNIPDFPQYYISSTVLDNQEAITIKFNQSLFRTLFIGPENIQIMIYNYLYGRNETTTEMRSRLANWGWNNFPGNFTIYTKDMVGTTGIIVEHPYSEFYNNINVLDASAYIDSDSSGKSYALLEVVSNYDRIVTGAIIDSMTIKKTR
jgi:hypothetical protein